MMSMFARSVAMVWISVLLLAATSYAGKPVKRVLLIYGSVGMGHESAARGIAADLMQRDPTLVIDVKDLLDFIHPIVKKTVLKGYDILTQRFPWLYDESFRDYADRAALAKSLASLPGNSLFPPQKLEKYTDEFKPDLIISTYPFATENLAYLREKGRFRDIPMGWVHTDLVDESYFARMPLQIDMAFVGIPEIALAWQRRGLPADRVMATGMPLSPKVTEKPNAELIAKLRAQHGIKPDVLTILLMGGSNGVGNYPLMVKEILKSFPTRKIQIIAVCGRNQKHQKHLNEMKSSLTPDQNIHITGLVPQPELFAYMNMAHGIISKTGGLTPFELFYRQKPLVFLDINGGQEKYNADVFQAVGLAEITRDQSKVGELLKHLFENPKNAEKQIDRQLLFCENNCPNKIGDWVMSYPSAKPMLHEKIILKRNGDYPRPKGFFWACQRMLRKMRGQ